MSNDVTKHIEGLKADVYVLSGQVKGKTLLPIPAQAETLVLDMDIEKYAIKNLKSLSGTC